MQDIVRRLQQLAGTGEVEQLLELLAEVVPSFADYRQPLETLNLSDDTSLISHA
jgi:hypothetical protein